MNKIKTAEVFRSHFLCKRCSVLFGLSSVSQFNNVVKGFHSIKKLSVLYNVRKKIAFLGKPRYSAFIDSFIKNKSKHKNFIIKSLANYMCNQFVYRLSMFQLNRLSVIRPKSNGDSIGCLLVNKIPHAKLGVNLSESVLVKASSSYRLGPSKSSITLQSSSWQPRSMNPMNRTLDTKTPFQNYRYRKGETRNENTRVLPFSDSRLRLDNCLQGLKEQRDSGDISTDLRMHSDLIMRSLDRQFKLISQLESQLASMRRSISGPNLLPNKNDVLNRFSSRMDYLHD